MLDSVIRNPIPTRAEVSDVANAVYDSADAVMLSGETASGKYPLEAVEIMNKILRSTERMQEYPCRYKKNPIITNAVAHSVTYIASEIHAKAIFTGAITGNSAKIISFFRPKAILVAITNNEKIAQQLALVWGVVPLVIKNKKIKTDEDLLNPGVAEFIKNKTLSKGDKIIFRHHKKIGDPNSPNTITVKSIE
jgi:pyruvate kinase